MLALMKRLAAISGLVAPLAASRATPAFLRGQVVLGVDGPAADVCTGRGQLAVGPAGERVGAHRREQVMGGRQLRPGVTAPALAPQPLAVEQVAVRPVDGDRGAFEL